MIIVITGLDGSGTSSLAKKLNELDKNSHIIKTPGIEFTDRENIDKIISPVSPTAHMLYYLASTVYASDYIKKNWNYKKENIYIIRYLIDTVVSNRAAGIDMNLNYNIYGNELLVPDLTIFIGIDENQRQKRISNRGNSTLDYVLDNDEKRNIFLQEFENLLIPEKTLYIDNTYDSIDDIALKTYKQILLREQKNISNEKKLVKKNN